MKTSRHKYNNLHNAMVDAMRRAESVRAFLVLSLLLLLTGSISGQSAGWNYVMTVCPLEGSVSEPSTDADMSRVTIEYLDDLGRKISTVNVGASYAVQDMADYITYDGRGRVSRQYLPFETPSSTGSFPQSAVSTARAYHGDLYCFSETTYDGTADSRVASVTGPGQAWHATGKSVKTRHLFNNATGEGPHACVIFQAQGDSLDIYLTYRADGVKRLEQTRRRYIKVITRVDGEGNVTTVNRPMTENHVRRYYGSMVTETGRDRRIYNEVGYIDVHNNGDSVSYHYYERDYLGSVRLVVNECGDIEQATDYCVGGLPSTRLATGNVDRRHHTSKEMLTFHGVSLYDNQARWYDPILCRFTTPDPLAEQYPDLSPYSHCANNPLTYVDPDGREWRDPKQAEYLLNNISYRIGELSQKANQINVELSMAIQNNDSERITMLQDHINEMHNRISHLQKCISDIEMLSLDENHYYEINSIPEGTHYVKQGDNNTIIIESSSTAMSIHEITHVAQALNAGGLSFDNGKLINAGRTLFQITHYEIEAYRRQFSYDDTSFPGYNPNGKLNGINVHSVGNIRNADGMLVYPKIKEYSEQIKQD